MKIQMTLGAVADTDRPELLVQTIFIFYLTIYIHLAHKIGFGGGLVPKKPDQGDSTRTPAWGMVGSLSFSDIIVINSKKLARSLSD